MCWFILFIIMLLIFVPTILIAIDAILFEWALMEYVQEKAQDWLNEKLYWKKD
jgi:hypothetical protein